MKDLLIGYIQKIAQKHFDQFPVSITRMKNGLCSEVYDVQLKDQNVIVRMNKVDKFLLASEKFIPIFREKGINVPTVIASDYSKKLIPLNYQILSKMDGRDLGDVMDDLTNEQLANIAKDISKILVAFSDVPTSGRFGYVDVAENDTTATWLDFWKKTMKEGVERAKQGVLDEKILKILDSVFIKYQDELLRVPSKFYFDDICMKNVMIHNGALQGLVDIDGVAYGDYLDAVGRIKASWYGTSYGKIYTDAVMDNLELDKKQREMVVVYALLNRIFWITEHGIKSNQNTSKEIDWKKVDKDRGIIYQIVDELAIK